MWKCWYFWRTGEANFSNEVQMNYNLHDSNVWWWNYIRSLCAILFFVAYTTYTEPCTVSMHLTIVHCEAFAVSVYIYYCHISFVIFCIFWSAIPLSVLHELPVYLATGVKGLKREASKNTFSLNSFYRSFCTHHIIKLCLPCVPPPYDSQYSSKL